MARFTNRLLAGDHAAAMAYGVWRMAYGVWIVVQERAVTNVQTDAEGSSTTVCLSGSTKPEGGFGEAGARMFLRDTASRQ
ncbi:hypothetical protein C1896_16225 [Pseudomonadaceae bacterium SI-3]|nr:hypothetical protein C1896_16225 [Pseudomonadaceae bacterium SI-3]